jgi:uncharacterized protein
MTQEQKNDIDRMIRSAGSDIIGSDGFRISRMHRHHYHTNVADHSINVAEYSVKFGGALRRAGIRVNTEELVRGALLHDYFLYNLYDKRDGLYPHKIRMLRGIFHPGDAYRMASKYFQVTDKEKDIIIHHMWPLTIIPPMCREAWIVTAADKFCAIRELINRC